MNRNFKFHGFIPNTSIKKQGQVFYSQIESRSPSDSKKNRIFDQKR